MTKFIEIDATDFSFGMHRPYRALVEKNKNKFRGLAKYPEGIYAKFKCADGSITHSKRFGDFKSAYNYLKNNFGIEIEQEQW
jgi:hypothetical protein